jgi:hypothetical protein
VARVCSHTFWSDARHYQIAALCALLVFNLGWLDFGAQPLNSALAIGAALATQALCTYLFALPSFDPRSPLITGLSLAGEKEYCDIGAARRMQHEDGKEAKQCREPDRRAPLAR